MLYRKSNSGHPGLPLGAASMALLYGQNEPIMEKIPIENRDRFVLSAGHGSMLNTIITFIRLWNNCRRHKSNSRQWGK